MSHSPTDQERAWDFGMVDADVIAFPVCKAREEQQWSAGRLSEPISYWHERNRIRWQPEGKVNYVRVSRFRAVPHGSAATKGVTEGSETSVAWKARFSSRDGVVEAVEGQRITIARAGDGHRHTQTVPTELRIVVAQGEEIALNQIIASGVTPEGDRDLRCAGALPQGHLPQLLASRERTQRFTGVKLARLRGDDSLGTPIAGLESDQEEDFYIRLEAAAYLVAVRNLGVEGLFAPYLASPDQQIQLEAVIALGEAGTGGCVRMLSGILDDADRPYFARSAAAWCPESSRRHGSVPTPRPGLRRRGSESPRGGAGGRRQRQLRRRAHTPRGITGGGPGDRGRMCGGATAARDVVGRYRSRDFRSACRRKPVRLGGLVGRSPAPGAARGSGGGSSTDSARTSLRDHAAVVLR